MNDSTKTFFAPQLFIPGGVKDIDFYSRAFGAVELRRWMNDDGSIHVAELVIGGALFHLHEESQAKGSLSPQRGNGTTVLVGLFTPEMDALMNRAIAAGGKVVSPAQDYDYDYRQGEIEDPFGHRWLIQKKIG
jgi:PhnB protein